MAALSQVVDVLETLYPLRYAEQWDEPGLIAVSYTHLRAHETPEHLV